MWELQQWEKVYERAGPGHSPPGVGIAAEAQLCALGRHPPTMLPTASLVTLTENTAQNLPEAHGNCVLHLGSGVGGKMPPQKLLFQFHVFFSF